MKVLIIQIIEKEDDDDECQITISNLDNDDATELELNSAKYIENHIKKLLLTLVGE